MLLTVTSLLAALAAAPAAAADTACITMNTRQLPLDKRQSPLDSVSFQVAGKPVKVCYGRPSLRGRTMLGSERVPYGEVWRTGANEPTMIHTTAPISIAGVKVQPGSYSLYTVPGKQEWQIIVNRATSQWGEESGYPEVEDQEVGRGTVKAGSVAEPVEQFTIRAEPASGDTTTLVLEWERTRVGVGISPAS